MAKPFLDPSDILGAYPGPSFVLSADGQVLACSPDAGDSIPGLRTGASLFDLIPPDLLAEAGAVLKTLTQGQKIVQERMFGDRLWVLRAGALSDGATFAFFLRDETDERASVESLFESAHIDPLTGICNRRRFGEEARAIIALEDPETFPFIISFDIDHFKKVNDTWGHDIGDKVLCHVVRTVSGRLRASDLFARCGGEEFWVMGRARQEGNALNVAERLRLAVEASPCGDVAVTISLGVAFNGESVELMQKDSDKALYMSKTNGRNQTTLSEKLTTLDKDRRRK